MEAGNREVLDDMRVFEVGEGEFFVKGRGSDSIFGKDFESKIGFFMVCVYFEDFEFALTDFVEDGKGFLSVLKVRKCDLEVCHSV